MFEKCHNEKRNVEAVKKEVLENLKDQKTENMKHKAQKGSKKSHLVPTFAKKIVFWWIPFCWVSLTNKKSQKLNYISQSSSWLWYRRKVSTNDEPNYCIVVSHDLLEN